MVRSVSISGVGVVGSWRREVARTVGDPWLCGERNKIRVVRLCRSARNIRMVLLHARSCGMSCGQKRFCLLRRAPGVVLELLVGPTNSPAGTREGEDAFADAGCKMLSYVWLYPINPIFTHRCGSTFDRSAQRGPKSNSRA